MIMRRRTRSLFLLLGGLGLVLALPSFAQAGGRLSRRSRVKAAIKKDLEKKLEQKRRSQRNEIKEEGNPVLIFHGDRNALESLRYRIEKN